ncbi:MAG: hypothetical protein JSR82_15320 [Verrucomicrobia bacterium]|nr:hypothetical protein [Verrucomicrobiota bacterium]
MPYKFNGIGTWYWGKRNLHEEKGRCPACSHVGMLRSYDTGLYFVFLHLPLLPLGKKRILRECPYCHRHQVLPLAEWERVRRETMAEAAANYQRAPESAEAAIDLLKAAAAYQDRSAFEAFGGALGQRFARDAQVQTALADAADYFGASAEAAEAAQRARELQPDSAELRQRAAFLLVRARRTEEAAALLQPELQRARSAEEPFHWLLVEGFQAEGAHRRALEVLDQMALHYPASVQTGEYRKLRRLAEKHRDRATPIISPSLRPGGTRAATGGTFGGVFARWLPLVLLALVLTAYLGVAWERGQRRTMYLVNGLARPSSIKVNGRDYQFAAFGARALVLPEGRLVLQSAAGETTTDVHSGFWSRPFGQTTVVLNPDACALLVVDTTTYSKAGGARPGDGRVVQKPRVRHEFDRLDYVFEEFPTSLRLPADANAQKRRLGLLRVEDPTARLRVAKAELPAAEAAALALRWAGLHLDQARVLRTMATAVPRADFLALLRPHLARRPLLVEVHRVYQSTQLAAGEPPDRVEAEYRERLAAEPDQPDLLYLLARVTEDRTASQQMLERAARQTPPSAHALSTLAFDELGRGEWARGLSWAREALGQRPGQEEFLQLERIALFGLGRFGEYLARPEVKKLLTSNQLSDFALPLLATDAAGEAGAADRLLADYRRRLETQGRQGALERSVSRLASGNAEGLLLAQRAQWEAAAGAFDRSGDSVSQLFAIVLRQQWPAAVEQFEALGEEARLRTALLLYTSLATAGDVRAERVWEACRRLARRDSATAEALFLRTEPITLEFVAGLGLDVEDKAVFAAAFAHRPAAEKALLLQFARRLAVVPGLESALLRRLTE